MSLCSRIKSSSVTIIVIIWCKNNQTPHTKYQKIPQFSHNTRKISLPHVSWKHQIIPYWSRNTRSKFFLPFIEYYCLASYKRTLEAKFNKAFFLKWTSGSSLCDCSDATICGSTHNYSNNNLDSRRVSPGSVSTCAGNCGAPLKSSVSQGI